ncbi:MAG TPA: hypothetical protein ENJ95_00635 [Bacteroidetes bacterium]|nr:hypothetical protein [Bacteroidota bacterium]
MKAEKILEQSGTVHSKAMDIAHFAFRAQKRNEPEKAKKLFSEAYDLEAKAALLLANDFSLEPTRSIFFRSAAWLAYHAERYREAERMAAFGLSGTPPNNMGIELREIMELTISKLNKIYLAEAA